MAAPAPGGGDLVFDPDARLVNMSVFDLLLIELVPLAERMARAYEASLDRPIPTASTSTSSKRTSRGPPAHSTTSIGGAGAPAITVTSSGTTTTTSPPPATQSQPLSLSLSAPASNTPPTLLAADGLPSTPIFADSISVRLDNLGFRVGEGLSEKLSRDRARFQNYAGDGSGVTASTVGNINDHQLDVIKFLCKDVWGLVWRKQVDNLKTNHRGVFVLTDSKFRPLMRMSMTSSGEALARAQAHLFFPCGIIRGVLASLGIKATVQAETTDIPSAVFQIKTVQETSKRVGI